MKTFFVLNAVFVAVLAYFADDIDWKNVRQADFTPEGLGFGPSIQGRIFGGNVAERHQFPYQVGLYLVSIKNNQQEQNWCGGSLISKQFVLTAAHCVFAMYRADVIFGTQNIQEDEKDRSIVAVSNQDSFIHPLFDQQIGINDVALIRLSAPVELNDFVQTIELPRPTMLQPQLEGHMVVMTGWGRMGDSGDVSNELQYANLTVLPEGICAVIFPLLFYTSQICVSGNVQSICPGDSGGPLVAEEDDGTKVVVGIASFIRKEGCVKGFPTVFTRVTSFLDWISHNDGCGN